jgi:hypothetical protein
MIMFRLQASKMSKVDSRSLEPRLTMNSGLLLALPTIKPPHPFSLSHQGRGAGVRGVYIWERARSNPGALQLSGNRPYSIFGSLFIAEDG